MATTFCIFLVQNFLDFTFEATEKKFKIDKILLKIHFIPTTVALTQWSKQAAILLNATALILLVKVDFGKKPCG